MDAKLDPEREVRFAVVMYGGVSLAIYINGVAQELLNMVRATSPDAVGSDNPLLSAAKEADKRELAGSAGVYRKLGQYLNEGDDDLEWIIKEPATEPLIRTRFVVDVISGTSAGGINGVFLAKALARNQKMDGLKQLWLSEGDLGKLLNDALSVKDLRESGFTVKKPQQSLLNSQRMYRKLLEALAQMGEKPDRTEDSPLVGELDLFITTTDVEGLPLPLTLADQVVYERRYRNVFHFRYAPRLPVLPNEKSTGRDDFGKDNDPFLAFAARCTSSFPFAFEPMRWSDAESVTQSYPRYAATELDSSDWDHFFSDYLRLAFYDLDKDARGSAADGTLPDPKENLGERFKEAAAKLRSVFAKGDEKEAAAEHKERLEQAKAKLREAFRSRSFGDGGYLDNKPFSYATSTLMRRHSYYTVDRKLIYVEPSPEHPELMPQRREPPDFVENIRAALLDLPRRETIREDLDRLYERNEMLARVGVFAAHVDNDLSFVPNAKEAKTRNDFIAADLKEMIGFYGISYGAYHRIRVEETTNLMAELVARAAGYDPSSDAVIAIRELVAAWRVKSYEAIKGVTDLAKMTENQFLASFDIDYRLRRLFLMERRIRDFSYLGKDGELGARAKVLFEIGVRDQSSAASVNFDRAWVEAFQRELKAIKKQIGQRLQSARLAEESLLVRDPRVNLEPPDNTSESRSLSELLSELQLPWTEMKEILQTDRATRPLKAQEILDRRGIALIRSRRRTLHYLAKTISIGLMEPIAGLKIADERGDTDVTKGGVAARVCLDHYYGSFAHYDLVTYPVQYGTGATEANMVDVFRVSPEDAVALVDERQSHREKLAGRALMSFGAFLDQGWRKNDMLWGRLDGAERLICALLPLPAPGGERVNETPAQKAQREKINLRHERRNILIKEAHVAILKEEIAEGDVKAICNLIGTTLARCNPSSDEERKLRAAVERAITEGDLPATMRSVLYRCLDQPEKIWDYYSKDFEVNRHLAAETALRLISRATNITGGMLEGLADKYSLLRGKRMALWIARLGSTFWNMIGLAVPSSLGNMFFRHWLGLLYLFSLVVIFAGILFTSPARFLGWQMLGATVALNLVVSLLGDFISGGGRWLIAARAILLLAVVALLGCGIYFIATQSAGLIKVNELAVATICAGVILLLLGWAEWRRWLKFFRASPHADFSSSTLGWLTVATLGLIALLGWIGPRGIARLEFAGNAQTANNVIDLSDRTKLYWQLGVDYLFLIVYSITFASYCLAAVKMFWQQFDILQRKLKSQDSTLAPKQTRKLKLSSATLDWLLTLGFVLAALQCVAGAADATENAGMLWFIHDKEEAGLQVAFYAAFLKFVLIGLGALYSSAGFVVGAKNNPGRWSLYLFALFGILVLAFVTTVLWYLPGQHLDSCVCAFFRSR